MEGRGARAWRMVKRWRVSKGGEDAIPTRQQGKAMHGGVGAAADGQCRRRAIGFFKEIETKNKENKNPLENEMRKTQYEKHNTEGR